MPTLYMDFESGNNDYGGTSFALLASGTDGAITSTTFSSATASFPNDGSLINQYLSIFNGTFYAVYQVTAWVSSTSLTVAAISGGTALANTSARQYYIGGRWQTMAGATAVRTIPGDTVRIKASPNPTSIGSATWTGNAQPTTLTNIASSTNASPIAITTSGAHGLSAGDYIAVRGHTVNTNANGFWLVGSVLSSTQFTIVQIDGTNTTGSGVGGATGTFVRATNCVVKTASALVRNVALCGGLGQKPTWTAITNVVTSQNTATWKEGYSCASIAPNATFTTGKAAYYTLPATLDLSSYQQVAFWVQQTAGTIGAAGATYLALCSDTLGDTVVHTCNVPVLGALSTWHPVVVDFGAALSTTIRSVALYRITNNAAQTFLLDNIVACKASSSADSVTTNSLVSKSDGTGDEAWYAIESINNDAIVLANRNADAVALPAPTTRGYVGGTGTATTYKREPIRNGPYATTTTIALQPLEAGTAGNLITYSGGWDRTNMSTQSGQTWFNGVNGNGVGWTALAFTVADRLSFARYATGLTINAADATISNARATACTTVGISTGTSAARATVDTTWLNNNNACFSLGGYGHSITNVKNTNNASNVAVSLLTLANSSIDTLSIDNSGGGANSGAVLLNGVSSVTVGSLTVTNSYSTNAGISVGGSVYMCYINSGSTTNNFVGVNSAGTVFPGALNLNNFTINETTETQIGGATATGSFTLFSNRNDNTDGNNWQWQAGLGTLNQQNSVVDSPATTSWKMNPTNANATVRTPLRLKLGTVVCAAGSLVTVTARMRRDNTGLTMRLICPGGQISGVASDVFSDMTAAANTWETVTITFTPTKAGGVDVYAYAFGGTTFSGYVCNLTASQA